MRKTTALLTALLTVLATAAIAAFTSHGGARAADVKTATATAAPGFVNFELSRTPGTTCPGGGSACTNAAGEPAIRADGAGRFFTTSENGLGAGTLAWRSLTGGRSYQAINSPDQASAANETGFAPGGGDTDVAVAPVKNLFGYYNVYVASLSLANIDVSTSQNAGATWRLNPVTTPETIDDREWIAADGMQKVCISYHNAPQGITVGCSTNAGLTFAQWAPAIDAAHAYQTANNAIGNLAIDARTHTIYQIYSGITKATEVACAPQFGVKPPNYCDYHGVYIAVSTDGGKTFVDRPVYVNPNTKIAYGHQFTNVSIDQAGNVYAVYSDIHYVWYSVSKNGGTTWSAPVRVSGAGTAIMPWSTALAPGKLAIVYYKSPYYDSTKAPDDYPASATWKVELAQNLHAASGGGFTLTSVTPVIHKGGACLGGVTCTGNRDLYDDFGVAA
ncbi:MAG: hypothetical protein QOE36_3004, partial [Gaiellaceae bacterium]|nr:hypothetical protein [Gaiellaceae bacterium]